jgi:hypothetical protein
VWIYKSIHVNTRHAQNEMMGVFSTMSSIHKMSSILAQFQLKKQMNFFLKTNKNDQMKTLDPSLHLGSPNHKLFFELPI